MSHMLHIVDLFFNAIISFSINMCFFLSTSIIKTFYLIFVIEFVFCFNISLLCFESVIVLTFCFPLLKKNVKLQFFLCIHLCTFK